MVMDTPERIAWCGGKALAGAELLCVTGNTRPWTIFHERYTLCSCRRGLAETRYRSQTVLGHDQDLMFYEPGELHRTLWIKGSQDFDVLCVPPGLFLGAAEELGLAGAVHFRQPMAEDPRLEAAMRGLAASVRAAESLLAQQHWLTLCLRWMLGYGERTPRPPAGRPCGAAIRRAMDCLQDRYQEPVDLNELSALTGLSRFALAHTFSQRVGLPPHAYQVRVQIERGRALLEARIAPARVAMEVGFADQSHFTRHFKRIMGVTPGQYVQAWWPRRSGS